MAVANNQPLVSILIPCYNAEKWVGEAIQSALDQTYSNTEVIVVDDGSTDGSVGVIQSFGDAVRWETGRNRGGCAARNRAFSVSHGEYLVFYDADDLMSAEKVERQVDCALANPGALVYGPWRLVWRSRTGPDEVEARQTAPVPASSDLLEMHLVDWFCPCHSYLWPRAVIEALGGWDETLAADQDADLVFRAILGGVRFAYCPDSWVDYVQHPGPRASRRRSARALRSRARVVRKVQRVLEREGRLADQYRRAIAWRSDDLARDHWEHCRPMAAWCAREARRVSGKPTEVGAWYYRLVRRLFGVYCAERLAVSKRHVKSALSHNV